LYAVPVQPGDTLSGIAAAHGESLAQIEANNPQFTDPNLIYVGQEVNIGGGGSETPAYNPAPTYHSSPTTVYTPPATHTYTATPVNNDGSIYDVPGVPSSFVHCVAFRESSDGANQAYNGGVYGIIDASGYHVNGQSLGAQKQAFKDIYDSTGPSAWAADGCPGT
jgi:hypothetical protein